MTSVGDIVETLNPTTHPLKVIHDAQSQDRFVYALAPMVRYGKLAFRQTVHHYGVDLCWTPMIITQEFNRNSFARDSDFTVSTFKSQPPTIAQFGSNDPTDLARASSLVAPFVNGVDLNCGCPQSWACSECIGAALMHRRELVRDMIRETRSRLEREGWSRDPESPRGRSVSVKIRVHADLRHTVDFLNTVIDNPHDPLVDFVTIHPRTRSTPSTTPINSESLTFLAAKFAPTLPILLSGDVFSLTELPFSVNPDTPSSPTLTYTDTPAHHKPHPQTPPPKPSNTNISGLMSARGVLANPALFAGHSSCPWEAVELFLNYAIRCPLPFPSILHHLMEMCSPGMGTDKSALLTKQQRATMYASVDMLELLDFFDDIFELEMGRPMRRDLPP